MKLTATDSLGYAQTLLALNEKGNAAGRRVESHRLLTLLRIHARASTVLCGQQQVCNMNAV